MTDTLDAPPPRQPTAMTHRQVLEALSGLFLALFVTMLSATVVSAALPQIIGDVGGGQSAFTWVVTSTLLATTVSTPIWGKLADLVDRKLLMQLSLVLFVVGSALAGLSQTAGVLITFRAVQGLGAGGVGALVIVVMADIISPRERGRYMGYLGATMAVSTISGPLLGGVITDTPWLGWRWCFYVGVPVAAVALVLLQRTLHLPPRPHRVVRIDYLGALLISGGVSCLLLWVSLAGHHFAWRSWQSAAMVGGGVMLIALLIRVETRAAEPIIPLGLFRDRTIVLAVAACVGGGMAMFGTGVFLSQYMQIARGEGATLSGVLTIPMMVGVVGASTASGRIITRTGAYKRWLVLGSVLLVAGLVLMGTIHYDTSLALVSTYMLLIGAGIGMVSQNLMLAVQNVVPARDLGAASAAVTFFRTMGGATGVSVLGAVLGSRLSSLLPVRLAEAGVPASSFGDSRELPDVHTLPPAVRTAVESSYGDAIATVFLVAAPVAVLALVAVLLMREVPLDTRTGAEQLLQEAAAAGDADMPSEPVMAVRAVEAGEAFIGSDPHAHDRWGDR